MHVVSVLKKLSPSFLEHRTKYAFDRIDRNVKGTIIGPTYAENVEHGTALSENLHVHTIPYKSKIPLIREIRYCLSILRVLKELGCDIINLNSHLQISALPVVMVSARRRVPLVVTVHGVYSKTNFIVDTIQKIYLHTFCRILWRRAKAVVCLTQEDGDEIVSYGCPRDKIVIIPNWVNTELFSPDGKKDNSKILWAGRFVPPKGLEYLIRSAKIVNTKFPESKFVLIGDGPLKKEIVRRISNEKLTECFELKGFLPQDLVAREMNAASIFAFPSLKEGMPYAVLEAASSGMAIVASDIPGVRSILINGQHALLTEAEDAQSFAEALIKLLESEQLRSKLQSNARRLVEEAYTLHAVFNKTIDLYEGIIREMPGLQER